MKTKLIIITLCLLSVILFYFTFFHKEDKTDSFQYENFKIIPVKVANQNIYIKIAIWGVSADKEAIVISKDSSHFTDINKDIVFEGIRNYNLYYIKNDTLHIILDLMKQKNQNHSFNNIIKIDTTEKGKIYYDLYSKGMMLDDSIKIIKF